MSLGFSSKEAPLDVMHALKNGQSQTLSRSTTIHAKPRKKIHDSHIKPIGFKQNEAKPKAIR